LYTQSGLEITSEQSDLSIGIDEGLNAPQGSPRRWKDELLRAVDMRVHYAAAAADVKPYRYWPVYPLLLVARNKTVESLLEKLFSSAAVCLTAYNDSTRNF